VLERPDRRGPAGAPPGDLLAWTLPADHGGLGLPAVPAGRRLLLELQPPAAWALSLPPVEERLEVFLEGAESLAGTLHPDVLLPFPEPDGLAEAGWLHGIPLGPQAWADLLRRAADRVAAVSPTTRLGVRLAGDVSRSEGPSGRLLTALLAAPRAVDVVGPRLLPGGSLRGGAAQAGDLLAAWERRLEGLAADDRPELWVLAAGLSPLDCGERAQARFMEGCLARGAASPAVAAVIIDGWRDGTRTLGLCRPDGGARRAGLRLDALLQSRPGRAAR
jgi:hypothetical protein